jgi:hypothetical protein
LLSELSGPEGSLGKNEATLSRKSNFFLASLGLTLAAGALAASLDGCSDD